MTACRATSSKAPPALFDRLDRNHDGFLSKADFTAVASTMAATAATAPTGRLYFASYGERRKPPARTCLDLVSRMPEVNAKYLFAYGHSMGSFVTIGLAAITGSGIAPEEGFPAPSALKAEQVRTPFLILHGSADPVMRPQLSADFKAILDKNRVLNERTVDDGEGHPIDQTQRERVFAAVRVWFEKHGSTQP